MEKTTQSASHLADPVEFARSLSAQTDKRMDILRRIGETGSISEAARASGVSYKAAWQAIETLENLAGGSLVSKAVGGARGGGTQLTDMGRQVLRISDRIARARAEVLAEFTAEEKPLASHLVPSGATILTSMRNSFPAVVEEVRHGPALVRVTLRVDPQNVIRATVTSESAQLLGITPGLHMLVAAKATSVEIARNFPSVNLENRLKGVVTRSARSEKGGEVTIRLPSGLILVGLARHNHGLIPGMEAEATMPSNGVVIARED